MYHLTTHGRGWHATVRVVLSGLLIATTPGAAAPQQAAPPPASASTEALPFRFVVRELSLRSRGEVVLNDRFSPRTNLLPSAANRRLLGTSPYTVNVGRLAPSKFTSGGLTFDQTTTGLSMWNVTATMVTLPAGPDGQYTFSGDRFPLELSTTLVSPRVRAAEKFMVGIMDLQTLHAVAVISIGVPGIPGRFPPGGGGGGGGPSKDNLKNRGEEVINPAIMLMREEEPEIREHIVLDNVAAPGLNTSSSVQLTLRIGDGGEISATARITGGSQPGQMTLTPKIDPQYEGFYRARTALNKSGTKYAAVMYAENLPRVRVFAVDTPTLTEQALRANATVPITIHGVGLGLDSKVEIVPAGGGTPARVTNVQLANLNLELTADVAFPEPRAKSYSVRITSAGRVATAPLTIHVR